MSPTPQSATAALPSRFARRGYLPRTEATAQWPQACLSLLSQSLDQLPVILDAVDFEPVGPHLDDDRAGAGHVAALAGLPVGVTGRTAWDDLVQAAGAKTLQVDTALLRDLS